MLFYKLDEFNDIWNLTLDTSKDILLIYLWVLLLILCPKHLDNKENQ